MSKLLFAALSLLFVINLIGASSDDIKKSFTDEEIVPDILDELPATMEAVKVSYTTTGVAVDLGNALKPSQVREQPKVEFEARAGVVYTLLMTDPDAPSRANPTRREIRHWLVVNIEGNDVTAGEELFSYRGSGPPPGTSLHRYIFLLFEQRGGRTDFGMTPVPNNSSDGRANTSTRNLISQFNLTLVGGDYFQAENELNPASDNIRKKFTDEGIVPDVLDSLPAYMAPLKISYPVSGVTVNLGNELKPSQLQVAPKAEWEAAAGAYYTLLFTDPDAPSRTNHSVREFRHWLIFNIEGNDMSTGEIYFEYRGPGPMNGTDMHRYTFLLFQQNAGKVENYEFTRVASTSVEERRSTSAKVLMTDLDLTLIAGDYFLAQFENSATPVTLSVLLMTFLAIARNLF